MNRWKMAFFISLPLLCISSLFALIMLFGDSIAYTYLEVSYNDQLQANKILGNLIVQGGQQYSQIDFLHLLRQEYPDAFIVEEGNIIKIGANSFEFQSDKLAKVR